MRSADCEGVHDTSMDYHALPRRTRACVGRDRNAAALSGAPANRNPFLSHHRFERVGQHAVDADRIEIVAERQHGGHAINKSVGPGLVRQAIDLTQRFALRNHAPAVVGHGITFVFGRSGAF